MLNVRIAIRTASRLMPVICALFTASCVSRGADKLSAPSPRTRESRPDVAALGSVGTLTFLRGGDLWRVTPPGQPERVRRKVDDACWSWARDLLAARTGGRVSILNTDLREIGSVQLAGPNALSAEVVADGIGHIVWHPSGKLISFAADIEWRVSHQPLGPPPGTESEIVVPAVFTAITGKEIRPTGPVEELLGNQANGTGGVVSSYAPCFNPDGRSLFFARSGDLWIANIDRPAVGPLWWETTQRRVKPIADLGGGINHADSYGVRAISVSRRGYVACAVGRLFGSGGPEFLAVFDPNSWEEVVRIEGAGEPAFDASGDILAYQVRIRDSTFGIHARSMKDGADVELVADGTGPTW